MSGPAQRLSVIQRAGERRAGSEFCVTAKTLRCPICPDGNSLRRSHGRWYDFPYRLLGMRAYRCLMCNKRFYAWRHPRVVAAK